jgi:hypothetical protein
MANLPFYLWEIRQKTNINHGPLSSGRLMSIRVNQNDRHQNPLALLSLRDNDLITAIKTSHPVCRALSGRLSTQTAQKKPIWPLMFWKEDASK